MPPKAKIAAPIDRPLSKAYLREFTGWSTAEPPGISDPTSLRVMENVQINRDGSARIRPGLRYLSYEVAPDSGSVLEAEPINTLVLRGTSEATGVGGAIPLPAGTAVGDLLVVTATGRNDGGGQNTFTSTGSTMDDERLTESHTSITGAPRADTGHQAWWGTVTSLEDLDVTRVHAENKVLVVTFGDSGGLELNFGDSVSELRGHGLGNVSDDWAIPAMDVRGVVACTWYDKGTSSADNARTPAGYTVASSGPGSSSSMKISYWTGDSPSPEIAQVLPDDPYQVYDDSILLIPIVTLVERGTEGPGIAFDRPFVGTHEAFYLNDGTKAYLCAVREEDETVGFRVMVLDVNSSAMYSLTHPSVDFVVNQTEEVLNFTADTTYVKYLQIDNKIFALSNNGEPMRVFSVGSYKEAKALSAITRPEWENEDKLTVVHPDAAWIFAGEPAGKRRNRIKNPSFEENLDDWHFGDDTDTYRPASPVVDPVSGNRLLRLGSKPRRSNFVGAPLHDVPTLGVAGWNAAGETLDVVADGNWAKVEMPAKKGTHYARSSLFPGVKGSGSYKLAFNFDTGAHVGGRAKVRFFGVTGSQVGEDFDFDVDNGLVVGGSMRWVSDVMNAPKGAVSFRVFVGGENFQKDATHVQFKQVVLVPKGESTNSFHGDSGTDFFWTGTPNESSSVYHPPAPVVLRSSKVPVRASTAHCASIYIEAETTTREATLDLRLFNKNGVQVNLETSGLVMDTTGAPTRLVASVAASHAKAVTGDIRLTLEEVPFNEFHWVDAALLEAGTAVVDDYFDGSTPDVPTNHQEWAGKAHASASIQEEFTVAAVIPPAETRTVDTLVATGGPSVNTYSFGFFYTFENEVGESAASKITVRRAQRGRDQWRWETPNLNGEPSGTDTDDPNLAADQLVAYMDEEVFDDAIAQGAIRWNLYMFSWSDQDAVPVIAQLVGTRELPADADYQATGWIRVTPAQGSITTELLLPTKDNRFNYSDPSKGGQGLVASDRMVLVYDPTEAAVIRWTSNRLGEYTNFTASKGGGIKTLTSGNLYVPAAVKLWQNPQSADTICILCLGTDGQSASYYMAPSQVAQQSDAINVMGFEETTATPGTTSPYGVEIFNNSMYHPLDDQLMKSTASNYNINHKSQTDMIRDMWEKLAFKEKIISSQHDSRLYYIVNNPFGEIVEEGCNGNEVWVFDAAAKTGTWSRFLIQAHALRKIEFGGQIYMSVIRPDGVYYLDPDYGMDDVVDPSSLLVEPAGIAWMLETNTQGANRAHDAWCHLQQANVQLGYFQGRMRYGVRGVDRHGMTVDRSKIVRDDTDPTDLAFDIHDQLQVKRDMMEWFFYAESILDDEGAVVPSYGQVNAVQYRYAPISVNVGYEYGSVETFEYGRDVALAVSTTTDNGIPLPHLDIRRP